MLTFKQRNSICITPYLQGRSQAWVYKVSIKSIYHFGVDLQNLKIWSKNYLQILQMKNAKYEANEMSIGLIVSEIVRKY